jgi:hypothetical protein
VSVGLEVGFGMMSMVYASQTMLQSEETEFYSAMEVSIMARGDDGVINGHGEGIHWLTGMWDVTCDKW